MKNDKIFQILDEEEIPRSRKGRLYIEWIMKNYSTKDIIFKGMMGTIYPSVGKEFNESLYQVERAIRYARIGTKSEKFRNKEFLIYLCEKLENSYKSK